MFTSRDNQAWCSRVVAHCSCSWEWAPCTPGWERTAFQHSRGKIGGASFEMTRMIMFLCEMFNWSSLLPELHSVCNSLAPLSVSFSRGMCGAELAGSGRGREQWQECEWELLLLSRVQQHTCCPAACAGRSRSCCAAGQHEGLMLARYPGWAGAGCGVCELQSCWTALWRKGALNTFLHFWFLVKMFNSNTAAYWSGKQVWMVSSFPRIILH